LPDYDLPETNRYSRDDEWVREADPGLYRVGISDYAQQQLGDVVFVELPEVGAKFDSGQAFGVIESVKAVSDLFIPIGGEIIEVNHALEDGFHLAQPPTRNIGPRPRSIELEIAPPMPLGLSAPAEFLVEERHVDVQVGIEGIRRKCRAVVAQRLVVFAILFEQVGEIEVGFHVLAVDLQAAHEASARRDSLTLVVVHRAQVAVAIGEAGLQTKALEIAFDGLIESRGIRIEAASLGETFLGCGRGITRRERHAPADGRHAVFARALGAEIQHRLAIGLEQDPVVTHHYPIGTLDPESQ